MKKGTLFTKWIAVLCAMLLTVSLFAIPAFADTTAAETEADTTVTEEVTDADTSDETTADTSDETSADEEETTGSGSGTTTNKNEKKGLSTQTIVWLIVAAVVVVVGVVLGIKFRERIKKFLRVYKSEAKKIVWLPWDQTKKSTIVVIIVLLICAAAICLLDFGLSKGILAFINLF